MRFVALAFLFTAAAFGQNLTEFGAAAAGGTVGGASGKRPASTTPVRRAFPHGASVALCCAGHPTAGSSRDADSRQCGACPAPSARDVIRRPQDRLGWHEPRGCAQIRRARLQDHHVRGRPRARNLQLPPEGPETRYRTPQRWGGRERRPTVGYLFHPAPGAPFLSEG